jgi:hypothetical protein
MRSAVVLLLFALPAFGQHDVEVTVRLKAPPARAVPVYSPPPPPIQPPAGCRGYTAGCRGFQASGSCYGTPRTAPTAGCRGSSGCVGGFTGGYQMGVPVQMAPRSTAVTLRAPVGRSAPAVGYGATENYAAGNVPYGASLTNGTYATPTGQPPGPGLLGVPGAGFPFDGPIRRTLRMAAGYDPGPARRTVRAGF